MASYDGAVPPGGMGNVKVRVETKGLAGEIHKTAKVYTNDPNWEMVFLTIKGHVKPVITLSRKYLNLYVQENQNTAGEVEILAELDKPLTLTPQMFNLEGKLTYRLEEIERGKKFKVRFESIPGTVENYRGFLRFRTNYPEKPEITIYIWGHIKEKG